MQESKVHYYWLDLIRFLAAFTVLACHFRGAFFEEYTLLAPAQQNPFVFLFYSITRLGSEAVLVFFVLSGFLVGGKTIERLRQGKFEIKSYAIDRMVRIMLPLISALLLFIPVAVILQKDINWWAWIGNLFSLQGILTYSVIEPLWSLSYEVWFYILMGTSTLFFVKDIKYVKVAWAGIILFVTFLVFTKLSTHYLLIWLMGAFTYLVMPQKKNWSFLFFILFMLVLFVIILQFNSGSKVSEGATWDRYILNRQSLELLFAFFFCLFLQQIILIKPTKKWTISLNKLGTKCAAFSYTLYLTHVLVLRLLEFVRVPKSPAINIISITLYIGELLIAMLVAYLVYWCLEKRTASVKLWIRSKL